MLIKINTQTQNAHWQTRDNCPWWKMSTPYRLSIQCNCNSMVFSVDLKTFGARSKITTTRLLVASAKKVAKIVTKMLTALNAQCKHFNLSLSPWSPLYNLVMMLTQCIAILLFFSLHSNRFSLNGVFLNCVRCALIMCIGSCFFL